MADDPKSLERKPEQETGKENIDSDKNDSINKETDKNDKKEDEEYEEKVPVRRRRKAHDPKSLERKPEQETGKENIDSDKNDSINKETDKNDKKEDEEYEEKSEDFSGVWSKKQGKNFTATKCEDMVQPTIQLFRIAQHSALGPLKTAKLGAKPTSKTRWAVPVRNQKEKSSDYRSMLDDFKICEWKDCGSPKMKSMNSNN
ncbi:triadin-like [Diaphorina citri]|uniref:Triadin-like n=1 Tax=Diaphorina citri TaxID=121845 RepID=A0A1S4ELN3_DIACI|nr:triadin-like [Diaphorina citri]